MVLFIRCGTLRLAFLLTFSLSKVYTRYNLCDYNHILFFSCDKNISKIRLSDASLPIDAKLLSKSYRPSVFSDTSLPNGIMIPGCRPDEHSVFPALTYSLLPVCCQAAILFSNTVLIASFSKVRLATMRFKRLFSSSRSFIRLTSLICIPPYFAFQL